MKELAAALIASGEPAVINIKREGTTGGHSVTMQWLPNAAGPSQGRFLINNVTTTGENQTFTREQVEHGQITANIREKTSAQDTKMMHYSIDNNFPVIIAHLP